MGRDVIWCAEVVAPRAKAVHPKTFPPQGGRWMAEGQTDEGALDRTKGKSVLPAHPHPLQCAHWSTFPPQGGRFSDQFSAVYMEDGAVVQSLQPIVLAAGDEDLAAGDAVEDELLPPPVQLAEHVVQQQHRPLPGAWQKISRQPSFNERAAVRVWPWEA